MPLVNAKEMLTKAKAGHYAVGQFNINNLEWTKAILLTAQELNSPVILGVSEGAGKYMCGYKTVVGMVNGMLEELKITVPEDLNYAHSFDDVFEKYTKAYKLQNVKTTNMGTLYELQYVIVLKESQIPKAFIDEIRCRNGNLNIICTKSETQETL